MKELGDWAETVVIAGYSNGYAGYATTAEEYRSQQYEGGHTLHGQWTLAAYQETARTLALAMEAGGIIQQHTAFEDWRGKTESVALQHDEPDYLPKSAHFGEYLPERLDPLTRGNAVTLKFWSSNPTANYDFKNDYMAVQQQLDGEWVNVYTDADWSTKIRWQEKSNAYIAHLTWVPPTEASSGIYRLKHFGRYTNATGKSVKFEGESVSLQLD
jgi:neutral ceramidase